MRLDPSQHHMAAAWFGLSGFLQMLGQAAGIALGRFGRRCWTQQLEQTFFASAELHFGQRLRTQCFHSRGQTT